MSINVWAFVRASPHHLLLVVVVVVVALLACLITSLTRWIWISTQRLARSRSSCVVYCFWHSVQLFCFFGGRYARFLF